MARRKAHLKLVEQPKSLGQILKGMPREYLECRDLNHAWKWYTAKREGRYHHFIETIICDRCGSFKIRRISARGQIIKSHYKYAEGYLIPSYAKASTADVKAKIRIVLVNMVVEAQEREA
jgi:hypothetical protein